jgi:hypothetical protein
LEELDVLRAEICLAGAGAAFEIAAIAATIINCFKNILSLNQSVMRGFHGGRAFL